jgi:XTP/dITP diphosphohydrolase
MDKKNIQLLIASRNVHKIRELKVMLRGVGIDDILTLRDFPDYIPLEESGNTFEENAVIKATHAAEFLNKLVLADDSGLIVPSLNGRPGIFSARYAGNSATDADNRKKLLSDMSQFVEEDRFAYFECSIALAWPRGLIKSVTGICEGEILEKERGGSGFGYDSLFVRHEYSKTFAEMEESLKNRISHRRKAFDKIALSLFAIVETI